MNMAKYNEDAWRMVGEKVTADIAAAITAGLANGGAIATAIAGAITAGLAAEGDIKEAIDSAVTAHEAKTTGIENPHTVAG